MLQHGCRRFDGEGSWLGSSSLSRARSGCCVRLERSSSIGHGMTTNDLVKSDAFPLVTTEGMYYADIDEYITQHIDIFHRRQSDNGGARRAHMTLVPGG